jgi:hypothetical protein
VPVRECSHDRAPAAGHAVAEQRQDRRRDSGDHGVRVGGGRVALGHVGPAGQVTAKDGTGGATGARCRAAVVRSAAHDRFAAFEDAWLAAKIVLDRRFIGIGLGAGEGRP